MSTNLIVREGGLSESPIQVPQIAVLGVRILSPGRLSDQQRLGSVWRSRRLILLLARRDWKAHYGQTFLGLAWVLVQPLTQLLIFSLLLGYFLRVDTGVVPYPLYAISGLSLWTFWSSILNGCGTSLLQGQQLIKKLSFPRLVLPVSKVITSLPEVVFTLLLTAVAATLWGFPPLLTWLLMPLVVVVTGILGLSAGLFVAAITVRYRDLFHLLPYVVNTLLWFTPVLYPVGIVPAGWRWILYLNPLTGLLELGRAFLLGMELPPLYALLGLPVAILLLLTGFLLFRKVENQMADLL